MKPIVSRQMEIGKTKLGVSQRVESDAISQSPCYLISVGFSPVVTPGRDRVALGDIECISFAAKRIKRNRGSGL